MIDCVKMILQIAKIEIEITNQSFEFSANTYLRVKPSPFSHSNHINDPSRRIFSETNDRSN